MPELIIILVVALLILGPKKLPEIARSLGRGMAEFRRASTELQRTITEPLQSQDPRPERPIGTEAREEDPAAAGSEPPKADSAPSPPETPKDG